MCAGGALSIVAAAPKDARVSERQREISTGRVQN